MVKLGYLWQDVLGLVKLIDSTITHGEHSLTNNCIVEVLALCHKSVLPQLLKIN